MKMIAVVLFLILTCVGASIVKPQPVTPMDTTDQIDAARPKTQLRAASPMPHESIGLFLEAESRIGPFGAPFSVLCNVNLRTLHNISIPIWKFPKITFYAEQDGEFFALRRVETHGGISAPYCLTGISVSLPRPPRPGGWRIFAIQEHSELLYKRHLQSHSEKIPLVFAEDQTKSYDGMWTATLVSNSIFIEFAVLDEGQMLSANSIIQGLIEAEQYDSDFREPKDDPTRQIRHAR